MQNLRNYMYRRLKGKGIGGMALLNAIEEFKRVNGRKVETKEDVEEIIEKLCDKGE